MQIRPERKHESSEIASLLDSAFGGPLVSGLYHALRTSLATLAGLSLVAWDAGHVVGHVILSRIDLDSRDVVYPRLMYDPAPSAPDQRLGEVPTPALRCCRDAWGRVGGQRGAPGVGCVHMASGSSAAGLLVLRQRAPHGLLLP